MIPSATRYRDLILLACFFGSGFLTLVYEVCWVRQASLVFGSATLALSTVLAIFFGGLALGSYLVGRMVSRVRRPIAWYARLELAIGCCALLTRWEFAWADRLFEFVYPLAQDSFVWLSVIRFALLAVILFPPALMMGGTLPLLSRHFIRSDREITWSIGLLYGLNTLGAAAGCATSGFWLVPSFGVRASITAAAVLNVFLGVVVVLLPRPQSRIEYVVPLKSTPATRPRPVGWLAGLFFLTGFLALGNEVLWARYLSLLMHDTVYTYTLTLCVVLLGLVAGSFASGLLFDRVSDRGFWLGLVQICGGLCVLSLLLAPARLWHRIEDPHHLSSQLAISAVVLLLPAILSGMGYPLFVRLACSSSAEAATRVGQFTALNTLGGIAGSLVIGFALLPLVGLHRCLLLTTGLSVAAGVVIWMRIAGPGTRRAQILWSVVALSLWVAIPQWTGAQLPTDYLGRHGEIVDFREGMSGHLAVVRQGELLRLEVDRLWQGENRKTHQVMAAHIPMLFHHSPERVNIVGIGPGQTASRFLMYPIKALDCVDIEAELFPLIKKYFNGSWLDDPRVNVIVEDGRNYLTHTDRRYDIISIEVGQTFRPCVSGFYSVDFYRRAKQRLAENGLLVQFASLEFLGAEEFQTVVRSFVEVFPQSVLWYNRAELLLIGTSADRIQLCEKQLEWMLQSQETSQDLEFRYWGGDSHALNRKETLLGGFLAGPRELADVCAGAPLYFSDQPFLECATSRLRHHSQAETVQLLRRHLGDITTLLGNEPDPEVVREVRSLQQQNLQDLLASELNWQAFDHLARRDLGGTIDCARQAASHNPLNFWSNLLLADALAAQGQQLEALGHYESASAIRPRDQAVRSRLERALRKSEKPAVE